MNVRSWLMNGASAFDGKLSALHCAYALAKGAAVQMAGLEFTNGR